MQEEAETADASKLLCTQAPQPCPREEKDDTRTNLIKRARRIRNLKRAQRESSYAPLGATTQAKRNGGENGKKHERGQKGKNM